MPHTLPGKIVLIVGLIILVCVLIIGAELLYIYGNGKPVPRPDTDRSIMTEGSGPDLRYVVMGDSTAVAQGGDYQFGYAVATAKYLAHTHTVQWRNVAVSGARAKDILEKQLPEALAFQPDIALIAVGANDVTHFTNMQSVKASLTNTIKKLQAANPYIKIILTGSPDMGSVPRFPQPLRWYAGERTKSLNKAINSLATPPNIIFAPIAAETGALYRAHPELFAQDKFHPTTDGYQPWIPVLLRALDQAGAQ